MTRTQKPHWKHDIYFQIFPFIQPVVFFNRILFQSLVFYYFFLTFLFELVLLFEFAVGRQMDFLMKLPAQAEKLSF